METDFIFIIDDFFEINENYVVTGELKNHIKIYDPIILVSEDMTAKGIVEKIEIFINDKPVSIDEAVEGQLVGIYLKIPDGFSIKKGMHLYNERN